MRVSIFKCDILPCDYNSLKSYNTWCALCPPGGSEGEERGAESTEGLGEKVSRRETRTCKEIEAFELEHSLLLFSYCGVPPLQMYGC